MKTEKEILDRVNELQLGIAECDECLIDFSEDEMENDKNCYEAILRDKANKENEKSILEWALNINQ